MKCRYCGGEVGLEEKFCPYCGKPNEQAVQHHQDMERFQTRFSETEQSVKGRAKKYSQIVPLVLTILFLLIGSVIMAVVATNAYAFPDQSRRRASLRDPERTCEVLDGFLNSGDYMSFSSYMDYYNIRTYDSVFSKYREVGYCAYSYKEFVTRLEKLFLHGDREYWLKYSADSDIHYFCDSIDEFYDTLDSTYRYSEPEDYTECIEDMRQTVTGMLRTYLGIREEETDAFLSLSANKKAAYVEEVILGA